MASPQVMRSITPYPLRIDTSVAKHITTFHQTRATRQPIEAPIPQRPNESVYLRRLDGTPYQTTLKDRGADNMRETNIGQKTSNHQNMGSHLTRRQLSVPVMREHGEPSQTYYPQRPVTATLQCPHGLLNGCTKCGQPEEVIHGPSMQRPRAVFDGPTPTLINSNSSINNLSIALPTSKRPCHKCGKAKRFSASKNDSQQSVHIDSSALPPQGPYMANRHTESTRMQNPTSAVSKGVPRRKPVPSYVKVHQDLNGFINIGVTPPTAIEERPENNVLTALARDQYPLLNINQRGTSDKPRRSTSISSIASSIRRSLSGRREKNNANHGGNGAIHLISMISKAIRGNSAEEYSKIGEDVASERRPDSPFSFMESSDRSSIELSTMPNHNLKTTESWKEIEVQPLHMEPTSPDPFADPEPELEPVKRPEQLRLRSDAMQRLQVPFLPEEVETTLGDPSRPSDLTRFKSLKSGVQRAGSVTRSTSLKRLNSLKNAPQLWYRTDMVLEGATVGAY